MTQPEFPSVYSKDETLWKRIAELFHNEIKPSTNWSAKQLRNCWTNRHRTPDLVPTTTSLAFMDKENDLPVDLMDQKDSSTNDQNENKVKEASNTSQLPDTELPFKKRKFYSQEGEVKDVSNTFALHETELSSKKKELHLVEPTEFAKMEDTLDKNTMDKKHLCASLLTNMSPFCKVMTQITNEFEEHDQSWKRSRGNMVSMMSRKIKTIKQQMTLVKQDQAAVQLKMQNFKAKFEKWTEEIISAAGEELTGKEKRGR